MTDSNQRRRHRGGLIDLALDGVAALGAMSIVHGVDLIYSPAAFIVAGAGAIATVWVLARKRT